MCSRMPCSVYAFDYILDMNTPHETTSEKVKEEWVELYKIAFIPKANDVKDYKLEEARHNAIIGFIHTQRSLAQQEILDRAQAVVLRRTEIPKDARNPTRDATVILGEEIVELLEELRLLSTLKNTNI